MAVFIKCVGSILRKTYFDSKRILKVYRTLSSFSNCKKLHNEKISCCHNPKYVSVVNINKCNFSHVNRIVPFNLSDIGEGIKEVTVKEWFVKVGEKVAQFDNICEVQSDKASVTITSRYDGIVTKLYYDIDDIAVVGKPLVDIQVNEDSANNADIMQSAVPVQSLGKTDHSNDGKVLATPAVRRLAVEHDIILSAITGTGRNGRVLKEDILIHLREAKGPATGMSNDTEESTATKVEINVAENQTELIQGFMKAMVKTMTAANMIPHFVYSDEIVVNELIKYYSQLKQHSKEMKITYMPFFIKAASKALEEFPIINSSVDETCQKITFKTSHNIGVAMDTPNGLVVPNIKNVQNMNIFEIAKELNRLHTLGLKGSLGASDLTGGTFTLSNIGSIGGTYTKPVILPPEVAIGAIGKIQVIPRYNENDELVKTNIMYVSWAADHRVIDGATMAKFSNIWKYYVQYPILMLLNK